MVAGGVWYGPAPSCESTVRRGKRPVLHSNVGRSVLIDNFDAAFEYARVVE